MLSLQICHINHFSSPLLLYLSSFYFFLLTFYSTWTLNIWSSPANYPSVISEVLSQVIYLAEVTYVLPSFPIRPLSVWFPPSSLAEVTNPLTLPNTCFYKVFLYHHLFPASPPPTHHQHMLWWEDILVSLHLQCWGDKFPLLQVIFFKIWFIKCIWHRATF